MNDIFDLRQLKILNIQLSLIIVAGSELIRMSGFVEILNWDVLNLMYLVFWFCWNSQMRCFEFNVFRIKYWFVFFNFCIGPLVSQIILEN